MAAYWLILVGNLNKKRRHYVITKNMKKYTFFLLMFLALAACAPEGQRVFGRFVPERKDDFAWENEYAAFRMYGPALAPENPSNGVDLWLKASPELIVDTFYYRETELGLPYHINYGKGLDCYKVGHTTGCGGLAIIAEDQLWIAGPYSRYEILYQDQERLTFRLEYDSVPVAGHILHEQITITAQAGTPMNKAEVVLSYVGSDSLPELQLGGGIFLHDNLDRCGYNDETRTLTYCEDALSDKTAAEMNREYNGSTSQGRSYIAVYVPDTAAKRPMVYDNTVVLVAPYQIGTTFTYYFGACWSRWSDGRHAYETDMDWEQFIAEVAANIK